MAETQQQLALRGQEYDLRLIVNRLQRTLNESSDPAVTASVQDELLQKQVELYQVEQKLTATQAQDPGSGLILSKGDKSKGQTRGADTTDLAVKVHLRMAQAPTAIYHLLDQQQHPLFVCEISNTGYDKKRRVRVISAIDNYSAQAVNTIELAPGATERIPQLPTLFPERITLLHELTRATLNIRVDDLDTEKIEIHETVPIWLLARNSAPLAVKDPTTGKWVDLSRYLGAFVTPHSPPVMEFLRKAAEHHREQRLGGYQDAVDPQVGAIFTALQKDADIKYVNSTIDHNPEESAKTQRIRLPRQSLIERQANCVDGVVLFASLLEAASLNPALVVLPKHVLVGWQSNPKDDASWRYLETTQMNTHTFDEAVATGTRLATAYAAQATAHQDEAWFRRWSVRELRTRWRITPME